MSKTHRLIVDSFHWRVLANLAFVCLCVCGWVCGWVYTINNWPKFRASSDRVFANLNLYLHFVHAWCFPNGRTSRWQTLQSSIKKFLRFSARRSRNMFDWKTIISRCWRACLWPALLCNLYSDWTRNLDSTVNWLSCNLADL